MKYGVIALLLTVAAGPSIIEYSDGFLYAGLLVIINDADNIGFYSITFSKMLIAPQYYVHWLDFNVYHNSNVNFFLKIIYEDDIMYIDQYGNVLLEALKDDMAGIVQPIEYKRIDDIVYVSVLLPGATKYYRYEEDLTLKEIEGFPMPGFGEGEILGRDRAPLDIYGLAGYSLDYNIMTQTAYVYDPSDKNIARFMVDFGYYDFTIFISNHIILQKTEVLAADATEYDFIAMGNKILMKTSYIDVLTGEQYDIDYPYYIDGYVEVYDKNKHYTVAEMELLPITEAKTLGPKEIYLVDKHLNVVTNLHGVNITNFLKVEGGYYEVFKHTLYDEELNYVTSLSGYYPFLLGDNKHIVIIVNGLCGVIDTRGRIIFEPRYDNISIRTLDGKILATKGASMYRLDLVTKEVVEIENVINYYSDYGIALVATDESYALVDARGVILTYTFDASHTNYTAHIHQVPRIPYRDNQKTLIFRVRANDGADEIDSFTVFSNETIPPLKSTTLGTESTAVVRDGLTIDKAILLQVGETKIHHNGADIYTHAIFKPEADGTYKLEVPHYQLLKLYELDDDETNMVEIALGYQNLSWALTANQKYIYQFAPGPGGISYYKATFNLV